MLLSIGSDPCNTVLATNIGFSEKWCHWINQFVSKGSIGVKVNVHVEKYFQIKKGLRQRDPLSHLLFNLVADMLATMISGGK
jgi:hypothetical protein